MNNQISQWRHAVSRLATNLFRSFCQMQPKFFTTLTRKEYILHSENQTKWEYLQRLTVNKSQLLDSTFTKACCAARLQRSEFHGCHKKNFCRNTPPAFGFQIFCLVQQPALLVFATFFIPLKHFLFLWYLSLYLHQVNSHMYNTVRHLSYVKFISWSSSKHCIIITSAHILIQLHQNHWGLLGASFFVNPQSEFFLLKFT